MSHTGTKFVFCRFGQKCAVQNLRLTWCRLDFPLPLEAMTLIRTQGILSCTRRRFWTCCDSSFSSLNTLRPVTSGQLRYFQTTNEIILKYRAVIHWIWWGNGKVTLRFEPENKCAWVYFGFRNRCVHSIHMLRVRLKKVWSQLQGGQSLVTSMLLIVAVYHTYPSANTFYRKGEEGACLYSLHMCNKLVGLGTLACCTHFLLFALFLELSAERCACAFLSINAFAFP